MRALLGGVALACLAGRAEAGDARLRTMEKAYILHQHIGLILGDMALRLGKRVILTEEWARLERGVIQRDDTVVVFNTGGALKYLDVLA